MEKDLFGPLKELLADRYRIDHELGRGGFATVYQVWNPRLERSEALKVLAPGHQVDEDFSHRFIQEVRVAAALEHPSGERDGPHSDSPPRRTRVQPRPRNRPSRHHARERHPRPRGPAVPDGLWYRKVVRFARQDSDRFPSGDAGLRRPGAGAGKEARRPRGHLRLRRNTLQDRFGRVPVRGRRSPPGCHPQAYPAASPRPQRHASSFPRISGRARSLLRSPSRPTPSFSTRSPLRLRLPSRRPRAPSSPPGVPRRAARTSFRWPAGVVLLLVVLGASGHRGSPSSGTHGSPRRSGLRPGL